ncbi:MAG: hypothetical protein D6772_03695 [Bacteroidetes bacterium]|nr:MAG: hypothetical protein D6772_03695 [Bacteroidota bacterium]
MKKSDKRKSRHGDWLEKRSEGQRRHKLKPAGKQKYKPKQYYVEEMDDDFSDIDLFGLQEDSQYEDTLVR